MGFWGAIVGGIIGSLFGGHWLVGAVIGNIVGSCISGSEIGGISRSRRGGHASGGGSRQHGASSGGALSGLHCGLFRCMGKLAKADGHVSEDEIHFVSSLMSAWGLPASQRRLFQNAFRAGRDSTMPFRDMVRELARNINATGISRRLSYDTIQLFCVLALADGAISDREKAMLLDAERALNTPGAVNSFFAQRQREAPPGSSAKGDLKASYECLGVAPDATDAEIKHAWRGLLKKYHPDKIANSDLPQDFKDFATRKTQEINAAYEAIGAARGW